VAHEAHLDEGNPGGRGMNGRILRGDGWVVTSPEGPHGRGCDALLSHECAPICDCGLVELVWTDTPPGA
jgi:hypothetical protein